MFHLIWNREVESPAHRVLSHLLETLSVQQQQLLQVLLSFVTAQREPHLRAPPDKSLMPWVLTFVFFTISAA